ncbi:hypothetical protein [Hymenobacter ruricola]|uniref:Lipoprotein n=1 Tax=Hymenobacter ruricola TaxID=2791023 RepID=A0ABS0I802_9BACT|nr:hypothetical protein [Hymenobacter ruricola]MBF9223024.1 hypothetical protein [Hymenobacter ruricola]
MNPFLAALLLAAAGTLGACNDSPVAHDAPATTPPPVPAAPAPDTTSPGRAGRAVPFVNPTKVGRVLGNRTPSPPASRTR